MSARQLLDPPLSELERLAASDDPFDQAVFELWRGRASVSSVRGARLPREKADAILARLDDFRFTVELLLGMLKRVRGGDNVGEEFYTVRDYAVVLLAKANGSLGGGPDE